MKRGDSGNRIFHTFVAFAMELFVPGLPVQLLGACFSGWISTLNGVTPPSGSSAAAPHPAARGTEPRHDPSVAAAEGDQLAGGC